MVRLTKAEKQRKSKMTILQYISPYDLEGSISDVSRFISELYKEEYSKYDDIIIEVDDGARGSDDILQLCGYKEEVDFQYNKRIEKLKKQKFKEKELLEEKERKMYVKLKKKFGNIQYGGPGVPE